MEPIRKFENGEIINLGTKKYTIKIDFDQKSTSSGRLVGNTIHLKIADGLTEENKNRHVYELVRKILSVDRQASLRKKLKELNRRHFNAHFKDVQWKRQMAQWGSCSENKYINISYRLLFAPEDVLEYVCIHELAHLLEFNHSKRFWKLVRNTMPDYEEKERWLRDNGGEIY
jgi:predicted metal-dependent hydrolase